MGLLQELAKPGSLYHLLKCGARLHPLESLAMCLLPWVLLCGPTRDLCLINAAAQVALFVPLVSLPALLKQRMSYVDIGWPCGLVLLAAVCYFFGPGYLHRRGLASACLLLHGGRMAAGALVLFFPYSFEEDLPRYQYAQVRFIKQDGMSARWWWLKIQHDVWQQCSANCSVLAAPFLLMAADPTPSLRVLEVAGAGLWLCCSAMESLADLQMLAFRARCKREQQKGAVIGRFPYDTAHFCLWTFCRHPNYFFEWMCWNCFALMAVPSLVARTDSALVKVCFGLVLLLASRLFYDCLLYWTGAEPAEYFSARKRPEYRNYQTEVRVFFPFEVPWVSHHRVADWPTGDFK